MPLGLLFGIGRAIDIGTMVWLDRDVGPWFAIPAGLFLGLALTLLNDALLAIGAVRSRPPIDAASTARAGKGRRHV